MICVTFFRLRRKGSLISPLSDVPGCRTGDVHHVRLKIESFEASLKVLRQQGWKTWETEHVRVNDLRGGNAKERAEELMSLFAVDSVDAVFSAAGGDFLSEILPYIDWQHLAGHPKWLMGASDPTGILFPLTTMCDIATLYGADFVYS